MRLAILLLAITCVLLGAPLKTSGDPFVRVAGHDLTIDRQPFHFVGANLAVMHGLKNRAATEAVIEGAAKDGLRVGRVWAFGEGDADAPDWQRESYLFRAGPDGWVESGDRDALAPGGADEGYGQARHVAVRIDGDEELGVGQRDGVWPEI